MVAMKTHIEKGSVCSDALNDAICEGVRARRGRREREREKERERERESIRKKG